MKFRIAIKQFLLRFNKGRCEPVSEHQLIRDLMRQYANHYDLKLVRIVRFRRSYYYTALHYENHILHFPDIF